MQDLRLGLSGPGEEDEELEEELREVESSIADLTQRRLEIQGELEAAQDESDCEEEEDDEDDEEEEE